jgi:hypothetical protein
MEVFPMAGQRLPCLPKDLEQLRTSSIRQFPWSATCHPMLSSMRIWVKHSCRPGIERIVQDRVRISKKWTGFSAKNDAPAKRRSTPRHRAKTFDVRRSRKIRLPDHETVNTLPRQEKGPQQCGRKFREETPKKGEQRGNANYCAALQ